MRSAVCYHTYPTAALMIPLMHLITSSHPFLAHLWPFHPRTASCSWAPGSVSSWLNWMDHASERFMFRVSESLPPALATKEVLVSDMTHKCAAEYSGTSTFSCAASVGIRLNAWKTIPILLLRTTASLPSVMRVISTPSINTCPVVGLSSPAIIPSSVLFPDPDGPTMETNSPLIIEKLMPLRMSMRSRPRGRLFVISRTSITTLRPVFGACSSASRIMAVFVFMWFLLLFLCYIWVSMTYSIKNCLKDKRGADFCDASGGVFSIGL